MQKALSLQKKIRKLGSAKAAKKSEYFFKTGQGQYGYGDVFLGISVPKLRDLAKKNFDLDLKEINVLIQSQYHEERLVALMLIVLKYKKALDNLEKTKYVKFYLKNKKYINNWDLVDLSSYKILGDYCLTQKDSKILKKLVRSNHHWDRRIAVVSTFAFIRTGSTELIFEFARILLNDKQDLMHKAVGWMLREAGKKDIKSLKNFIKINGKSMPRTMLRYAIEKFPENERKLILIQTK